MSWSFAVEILFWICVLVVPLALEVMEDQRQSRIEEEKRRAEDLRKSLWR